jgi:hypothetical protein
METVIIREAGEGELWGVEKGVGVEVDVSEFSEGVGGEVGLGWVVEVDGGVEGGRESGRTR